MKGMQMKNSTKNLLRALIALMLIVFSLTSMTSCLFMDFSFNIEDYFDEDGGENDPDDDKPLTPPNPSNPGGNGSDDKVDDELTFIPDDGSSSDNASALNRTLLSTVIVESRFALPSYGSGVFYKLDKEKGDAYIITNYHVIFDTDEGICKNVNVYLYGMELQKYAVAATVVGGSVDFDIAVLKVEGSEVIKNSLAAVVTIADSDKIQVFDPVYAVGNPEAQGISATRGIISVVSEYLDMTGADDTDIELRVIRTDAAINAGNSGGGLYNEDGGLIGIVSAKIVGSNVDNMGYAIPSNLARNLADNIIDNCDGKDTTQVHRALIGIQITAYTTGVSVDEESGEITRISVVEISSVFDTSVFYGQVKEGDIINSITVNGVTVKPTQIYHVTDHMLTARVGHKVEMSITRGTETLTVSYTVTKDNITLAK